MASGSDGGVQWDSRPVLNHINVLTQREKDYAVGTGDLLELASDVLEQQHAAGNSEAVERLCGGARKTLEGKHTVELHVQALEGLRATYQATGETSDFRGQLQAAVQAAEAASGYDAAQDPLYTGCLQAAGLGDGQQDEEQLDDDIAIAGAGQQLAPNTKCPITTRPILDLDEPVEDSRGYVFEKAAVLQLLHQSGVNPLQGKQFVGGSSHFTREADLRPAVKVLREKKKRQRSAGRATQQQRQQQQGGGPIDVL